MSLSRKGGAAIRPVMNVTPLVDVVLVLLIIFMVVIPAMGEGLSLQEPGIIHADEEEEGQIDPFVLAIESTGAMHLDEQEIPSEHFESVLRAANAREPNRRVVLRGDRTLPYVQIRSVMKLCQTIGFPGVQLRVVEAAGNEAATPR